MRKYKFMIHILLAFIFLSACNSNNITDENQYADDYFQYNINDYITTYDVENDKLYYISTESGTYSNPDGLEYEIALNFYINVMNLDGVIENSYTVSETISKLCIADGRIFFATDFTNRYLFYEYDKDSQSSTQLAVTDQYYDVKKIAATADKLFFIAINKDYTDLDYSLASPEDIFTYSGERIACVDLKTGAIEDLPINMPISFSKAPDNNLVVYAYDEEKGYYFTIYNTISKNLSERTYHNLGNLRAFDVYNDSYDFMFLNIQKSGGSFTLTAASLSPDKGTRELIQNYPLTAMLSIVSSGDYTYSPDSDGKNIIRIRNSAYLKSNKEISMYNSISASLSPFGCGYNIKNVIVSDEELALALLSQDPDLDICSINSRQDFSSNIRNKGSFYPLNDVKYVKEYLDSCFPYVKEAATDSDGDIWMLPIYVNINYFLYNESFCQSKGIEFSDSMSLEQLFATINTVRQDATLHEIYNIDNLHLTENLFYQYLRYHTVFNTDLFRKLAFSCKKSANFTDKSSYGGDNVLFNLHQGNSDLLFLYIWSEDQILFISNNSNIRAANIPCLTDDTSNVGTCYFLTVNPSSKRLKETLQYISSLSKYLLTHNSYLIRKDRTLYPKTRVMDDIYNIYANGDIQFTYPDELFMDDFEKFLKDEIDLDSFIKEADRRLDTFLHE
jgi:hypothetical protein